MNKISLAIFFLPVSIFCFNLTTIAQQEHMNAWHYFVRYLTGETTPQEYELKLNTDPPNSVQ
ncbi:MAG: hypothetical protein ABIN89_25625 [Chitinophagaceae bacterium]